MEPQTLNPERLAKVAEGEQKVKEQDAAKDGAQKKLETKVHPLGLGVKVKDLRVEGLVVKEAMRNAPRP